ncbi:MAG: ChbG/HpnK family deacetylase [Anaerostipes hadrus]|jgi:predicted glycoside hydrolase/deacetylase ChbG (UPF0249 family)|nr:ChbG/HpnK family deacetylase [Anaerostipes hadrus]
MKHIMVRADDLGYSEGINYGIEKSVKEGIIKNVGFMVNMPATQHGYDLLKDTEICLGQHTNICAGRPICDPKLIPSIVQENGEFKTSKEYRSAKEDFVVLDEVILEIEAQYEKFKEITGREPEYFEGHAIESENFLKGLEIVAKRHGLKYSGISFDGTPLDVNGKKVYMWMESMQKDYDPMQTFKTMVENYHEGGYDMLIFHPGYLDDYILTHSSLTIPRTKEVRVSCSAEMKQYLMENEIVLYTYNDL